MLNVHVLLWLFQYFILLFPYLTSIISLLDVYFDENVGPTLLQWLQHLQGYRDLVWLSGALLYQAWTFIKGQHTFGIIVKKILESQTWLLLLLLEFELSFRLAGWLLTFHAIQLKIISRIPTNLHRASYTMYSIHSFRQQLKYADI